MPVFDPSMTANKVADMLPKDALNASGKPNGADAPEVPGFVQTKGYFDARRTNRKVNTLAPELPMVTEGKKVRVHIFNVGPFAHIVPCGSAGTFYIPACPEGKPYVEMLTPLHLVQDEIYPKTRNSDAKRLYDDGKKMALEILGEGRGHHKKNSLVRVGCFLAGGEEPTAKELKDANAQVHAYASEQILYMDSIWDRDRKLAYDIYRPETFGACARVLGLTGKEKPWLMQGEPASHTQCPSCGEMVNPSVALCRNCKEVINVQAYAALRERRKEIEMDVETAPTKKK